jgi:hypothetical protein
MHRRQPAQDHGTDGTKRHFGTAGLRQPTEPSCGATIDGNKALVIELINGDDKALHAAS